MTKQRKLSEEWKKRKEILKILAERCEYFFKNKHSVEENGPCFCFLQTTELSVGVCPLIPYSYEERGQTLQKRIDNCPDKLTAFLVLEELTKNRKKKKRGGDQSEKKIKKVL